ncbi:unnamed protein product, partial [marine sediment metagenome]
MHVDYKNKKGGKSALDSFIRAKFDVQKVFRKMIDVLCQNSL